MPASLPMLLKRGYRIFRLRRLQQCRLVIREVEVAGGDLGFSRQRCDLLRPPDRITVDTDLPRRGTLAAFGAAPADFLRNLRKNFLGLLVGKANPFVDR